ncbi:MAG: hypothetical protein KAG84_01480 [Bacteroidales bacterium]|nr:hypothetical protein [Bacteroidales bacterium]
MTFRKILIFSLIFSISLGTIGCRSMRIKHKRKRDARQMERQKKEKEQEAMAEYQAKVQRQSNIQTPETKKRMKAQFKKSERYQSHRKEFFLKRWWKNIFGSKRKTGRRGEG